MAQESPIPASAEKEIWGSDAMGGVLAVAGGDGRVLRILEIQPEGKRVMAARDFLAGRRVEPGTHLS